MVPNPGRVSHWPTVLIGIVRFGAIIALLFYWFFANKHWNIIKRNAELYDGIYSRTVVSVEKLAELGGRVALFWNVAVCIPTFWFLPPLNLPFAVGDTVIAGYLIVLSSYQINLSPKSKRQCSNVHNLQRPPGANESFFEAAARLNDTTTSAQSMCEDFFEEWVFGAAVTGFYVLAAAVNILTFHRAMRKLKGQGMTLLDAYKRLFISLGNQCMWLLRFTGILIIGLLYMILQCLFRCLPFSVRSRVRFARRSVLKTGLGLEQKSEMQMTALKRKFGDPKNSSGRYQDTEGVPSPLADFLGIYDMLILVSENLHYRDMMNLSRVSKSIRARVLPTNDYDRRLNIFRTYTCNDGEKTKCWSCPNQTCIGCQQYPLVALTTLYHHLQNCRPFCTRCYRTQTPGRFDKNPYCQCAPAPAHPNIFLRMVNGSSYYQARQSRIPKYVRAVCMDCHAFTSEELRDRMEKETKRLVMEGRNKDGEKWTRCAGRGCGKELGMGPRWWVCEADPFGQGQCGKECSSLLHKGWGKGSKEKGKDEVVVGTEAV
ncbi:hypothetical protein P153DRAFT_81620 [Dothidotthia symphoricarpi CBS 119687]|uniref:F-box domain-containing protein n=1 Tax=Dothidotthia symphoricarpi CBS 119687 TaxID=1392245 RepID=A0A6A6A656_9PLEO|nr:uncharacterized protein P153DRAFT_81620 [Dothidotthia symphoricarpi CBS 119687]KAF2126633.1 hypothetical protein P153DRAFT_81620 [Dothidotthia symphoricarpi CBS 119687]